MKTVLPTSSRGRVPLPPGKRFPAGLPSVDFCGLNATRLALGANPFGGYSHQNAERDREMRACHTVAHIKETWKRTEAAGINTMVINNETPHVFQAVKECLG